jgi:hypothetical protein
VTVWLTAGLLVLSAGCRGGELQPIGQVVDSAGVRIVSYDLAGVSVPTYRAVGPRDLEIGVQNGPPEYTFSQITDLAVGEDRSIIVSDAVAREVRVFSHDGTYRGTVGRGGEGPGEFAGSPTFVGLGGDTLFAFDARARRLSAFLTTGQFVSGTSLWADGAGFTTLLLRLDDGSYVSQSNWVNPETANAVHDLRLDVDSVVVEHLAADAAVLDTLRLLGDRNRARSVEGVADVGFRTRQITTPYSPRAVIAVDGFRIIAGRSDDFTLEWIHPTDGLEMVVRVSGVQHPATAKDLRAREEAQLREDFGDQEIDPEIWRTFIEYLPERLPAFGDVVVSDGGNIWVSLTEFDLSAGLDWLVFSDVGDLLGLVHTPPDFRLRVAGDDFVVGFVLDDLDVPCIHRYSLIRAPTADSY